MMTNAFIELPEDASLDTICGQAGRMFAARKANNPQTDFNTEIWYLAGDAMSAGFSALRGMTKEQITGAMRDSISRHIDAQLSYYVCPVCGRGQRYNRYSQAKPICHPIKTRY